MLLPGVPVRFKLTDVRYPDVLTAARMCAEQLQLTGILEQPTEDSAGKRYWIVRVDGAPEPLIVDGDNIFAV